MKLMGLVKVDPKKIAKRKHYGVRSSNFMLND